MTTKEFRELIIETSQPDWFAEISIDFNLPSMNFQKTFIGLSDFHKYLEIQNNGYEKISELPNSLIPSRDFFSKNQLNLEAFVTRYKTQQVNHLNNYWKNTTTQNNAHKITLGQPKIFHFNSDLSNSLIHINSINENYSEGAFNYLTNSNIGNSRDNFIGALIAYEAENPKSQLAQSANNIEGIQELKDRIESSLSENETQLIDSLKKSKEDYSDYLIALDNFKSEKENIFNNWFEGSENTDGVINKISNLEEVYFRKLQLSKPARYWQTKSTNYYKEANKSKNILLWMIAISSIFLAIILIASPKWIFETVFSENKSAIIRWSLVFLALISLLAFAIRAITKVMFSSFHLARDAEERHTLTFFYLSLLQEKDTNINDEDRKLILQSLFSRAETGLLKDDSGPTMPNDFIGKIMSK